MSQKLKKIVIIPAYNESKTILGVIREFCTLAPDFDYIIINDGSSDNTDEICRENHLHHLSLPINLGIGGAVQTGYLYAFEKGYDIAIQMDGDGQHDPAYLDKLCKPIVEGTADFTIGSRFIDKNGFQSSAARRMGILFLRFILWSLTGKKIMDNTSGFRAANRKVIALFAGSYPKDYPEPESIITLLRNGLRIEEIPVKMRERMGGKSSIHTFRSIYYMIKVTLAVLIAQGKKARPIQEWVK
jgi:glycosyltransferase involved in cell wall biosynthesis